METMFKIETSNDGYRVVQMIGNTKHVFRTTIDGLEELRDKLTAFLVQYGRDQKKSFEELEEVYWRDQGFGGSLWSDGQPDNLDYLGGRYDG